MGSKAAVPGSRLDTVRPPLLRAMANARARRPKTESVAQVRSIPGPLREPWFRPRGRRGERNPRSERRDLQKVPERTGCQSRAVAGVDRKSTRSELQSLMRISYAVFCLKKKI